MPCCGGNNDGEHHMSDEVDYGELIAYFLFDFNKFNFKSNRNFNKCSYHNSSYRNCIQIIEFNKCSDVAVTLP